MRLAMPWIVLVLMVGGFWFVMHRSVPLEPIEPTVPTTPAPTLISPPTLVVPSIVLTPLPDEPEALSVEELREKRQVDFLAAVRACNMRVDELIALHPERQTAIVPGVPAVGLPGKGMIGNGKVWIWCEPGEFPELAELQAECTRLKP